MCIIESYMDNIEKEEIIGLYISDYFIGILYVILFPFLILKNIQSADLENCVLLHRKPKNELKRYLKHKFYRTYLICFGDLINMTN